MTAFHYTRQWYDARFLQKLHPISNVSKGLEESRHFSSHFLLRFISSSHPRFAVFAFPLSLLPFDARRSLPLLKNIAEYRYTIKPGRAIFLLFLS